jgi:hypothetical protein
LSDAAVVQLISTSFVPVAVNLYKIRDEKSKAGDFFRSVRRQKPQYQGLWLATWEGRVLGATFPGSGNDSSRERRALADLQAGLKEFGNVAPRRVRPTNPLPYRGIGVQPDGSVTLAITDRSIIVPDLSKKIDPNATCGMALDSVTLPAAEWSALAPVEARAGSEWSIPEAVGRRFFPILDPGARVFDDPKEVLDVRLAGRVISVQDGIASVVYSGRIMGVHKGTPSEARVGMEYFSVMKMIGGVGSYDIRARQMLSLTWVWEGRHADFYHPPYRGQPGRFGAVVEWAREGRQAYPLGRPPAPASSGLGRRRVVGASR